jgi:hypothetical protein
MYRYYPHHIPIVGDINHGNFKEYLQLWTHPIWILLGHQPHLTVMAPGDRR